MFSNCISCVLVLAHLKSGGFFEPDGSKFSPLESYDSSKYSNFKWHVSHILVVPCDVFTKVSM